MLDIRTFLPKLNELAKEHGLSSFHFIGLRDGDSVDTASITLASSNPEVQEVLNDHFLEQAQEVLNESGNELIADQIAEVM